MQLELELLADDVRQRAGLGTDDNEYATEIAVRLLGVDGVAIVPELRSAAYLRRRVDGGFQVSIGPTVTDARFAVMHEIAHWAIREIACWSLEQADEEQAANYLAAAILSPRRALIRAYRHFGSELRKLRPIAELFGLSQTATQLRLGEVLGDKRAVVTARHGHVLSRGSGWPSVPAVEIARGKASRPNVVKATLRGGIDEGRVALRVL